MFEKVKVIALREKEPSVRQLFVAGNKVILRGIVEANKRYSYSRDKIKFYRTRLMVERLSGTIDYIPVIISDLLPMVGFFEEGKAVEVTGQFRSKQCIGEDGKDHLDLFVYVTSIKFIAIEEIVYENVVYLEGQICKKPVYRKTSKTQRRIKRTMLEVKRNNNCNRDYIPCIMWGNEAKKQYEVGDNIVLVGRIQSRMYEKQNETKVTYEVSAIEVEYMW